MADGQSCVAGLGQCLQGACVKADVVAGTNYSCSLGADGYLKCWGSETSVVNSVPNTRFKQVQALRKSICGLEPNGNLRCWGIDSYQPSQSLQYERVATSNGLVCGILASDHSVECWGAVGATVPAGRFIDVATHSRTACAITEVGQIQCWNYNDDGSMIPPTDGPFVDVDGADQHFCAVRANGTLACWGTGIGNEGKPSPNLVTTTSPCARTSTTPAPCVGTGPRCAGARDNPTGSSAASIRPRPHCRRHSGHAPAGHRSRLRSQLRAHGCGTRGLLGPARSQLHAGSGHLRQRRARGSRSLLTTAITTVETPAPVIARVRGSAGTRFAIRARSATTLWTTVRPIASAAQTARRATVVRQVATTPASARRTRAIRSCMLAHAGR